jgi:hypothetical protein
MLPKNGAVRDGILVRDRDGIYGHDFTTHDKPGGRFPRIGLKPSAHIK